MNIFLESVSIEEIRNASAAGFADGVVFSEGAFAESSPGNDPRETIAEIAKEFAIPVCVEVGAISSDDLVLRCARLGEDLGSRCSPAATRRRRAPCNASAER